MTTLSEFFASPMHWGILFFCALLIGMAKTGVQGITIISIPLLAMAFGAKESKGVILPFLCIADVFAVIYYRQTAKWKYVFRLLPAAIAGLFVAIVVDKFIPHEAFKHLLGFCIFLGLAIMIWGEFKNPNENTITDKWWYSVLFGIMGGFTSMIGNAAGSVMAEYLLSMRMPKLAFVGTNAWFFLVINYLKIPLQVFAWDNISLFTLTLDFICIPIIFVGALLGIWFTKKLPDKAYRIFVIVMTLISTLAMIW